MLLLLSLVFILLYHFELLSSVLLSHPFIIAYRGDLLVMTPLAFVYLGMS